jgi:hypothetical protein
MAKHQNEATDLLLASMFRQRQPDRRRHSFAFNKPGKPIFSGGWGTEVNYDNRLLLQTALYLRKNGSPHLRSLSISRLESILTSFVSEHYYLLANETFLSTFEGSYADNITTDTKAALTTALAASSIFVEPREITLFPLIPITVEAGFNAAPFFIGAPADLVGQLGQARISGTLIPDSFPPMGEWEHRRETPRAWLGVRAPTLDAARQMRAAILGAVALLPHHMERYMFSGRKMFGGYTTLADGWSMAFGDPHTPALMTDLIIDTADHVWLSVLAEKIVSPRKDDKRQLRALEYYYRAWSPDPVKRFPTLFAALDAIYGDAGKATQAVVDAIGPVMGPDYTSERIRLMLGLRASVIHGGAPNVYESSKYEDYYKTYLKDATRDLELIVARCLQTVIFPSVMSERPHNHADIILRETGRAV